MLPTYVLKCKPGPHRLVWMNATAVNEATNTRYETTFIGPVVAGRGLFRSQGRAHLSRQSPR